MITSFRHDKARLHKRRQFLGAFFVLAFIIFLARGPLQHSLGGVLHTLGRPFWSIAATASDHIGGVTAFFHSKSALEEENKKLQDSLDLVAAEAYAYELLRRENEELKTKLGRSPEFMFTLARVLVSPSVSPYDTLIIDAGEDHGVVPHMEVFGDGDFKIGEVTRVFARSAVVSLYSTPDTELSVSIGSSSIPVIVRGAGGGNFRATLPKGAEVAVGDAVEIPALAPEYAGVVDAIVRPEGTSLQTVFIKLPFNLFTLKWVYLAKPLDDRRFSGQ
jgi:cell shape-determining protein MreC